MSYDIGIYKGDDEVFCVNFTWNLATMAEHAFSENGDGVMSVSHWKEYIDGKDLQDAITHVRRAVKHLRENPAYYQQFNSRNGWGTYKDFLPIMENLLYHMEIYRPNLKIKVD